MFFGKKWDPKGKHAYVTGGSTGLGLALSLLLAKKGANVSIVARTQSKLDAALEKIESARQDAGQVFKAYSVSLSTANESAAALRAVCALYGGATPDAVFACAGSSKPGFFVEMNEDDLTQGMVNGYWVQAWTALAVTKMMVQQGRTGKIVFVSSTLGYVTFVGWSSYSPAKQALRGLADTLHSELKLYGIDVHIFFPPTMFTPGLEEENKTKPKITLQIEGVDDGLTPEKAAVGLLKGVQNGDAHISADIITSLFRASTRGAVPRSSWFLDGILDFVSYLAMPFMRMDVNKKIGNHRNEHLEYLRDKGIISSS